MFSAGLCPAPAPAPVRSMAWVAKAEQWELSSFGQIESAGEIRVGQGVGAEVLRQQSGVLSLVLPVIENCRAISASLSGASFRSFFLMAQVATRAVKPLLRIPPSVLGIAFHGFTSSPHMIQQAQHEWHEE